MTMYRHRTEDRITAIDAALAASNIHADSASEGRRVYGTNHATERHYVGAVTVEDIGDMLTLTTTDAAGDVTATETVALEVAADRIAAILHDLSHEGVTPEDLRDAHLAALQYMGETAAKARQQRDRLILEARQAGATYQDLRAASGLSRAMLDRIINDRNYN